MPETKKHPPLVWLDLEMSGLDPDSERIIEIATVISSAQLDEIIEGPNLVIKQPKEFIDGMDEWNTRHHGNSGLIECLSAWIFCYVILPLFSFITCSVSTETIINLNISY